MTTASERAAIQAAQHARQSGRNACMTHRLKVRGLNAVYLHVEYGDGMRPVKIRLSAPGKYADAQLGQLLDEIAERVTEALR